MPMCSPVPAERATALRLVAETCGIAMASPCGAVSSMFWIRRASVASEGALVSQAYARTSVSSPHLHAAAAMRGLLCGLLQKRDEQLAWRQVLSPE